MVCILKISTYTWICVHSWKNKYMYWVLCFPWHLFLHHCYIFLSLEKIRETCICSYLQILITLLYLQTLLSKEKTFNLIRIKYVRSFLFYAVSIPSILLPLIYLHSETSNPLILKLQNCNYCWFFVVAFFVFCFALFFDYFLFLLFWVHGHRSKYDKELRFRS